MSLMPKFPGSDLLSYCDEDECERPSLLEQVVVAFVGGAAPVITAYVINRLSQANADQFSDDEEEEG